MGDILKAEIWYLDHSGFAVKTSGHLFIFDYCNIKPGNSGRGLNAGIIEPEEIRENNVTFFASHAHGDHFIPDILKLDRSLPAPHYVLSHDIRKPAVRNLTIAFPNQEYELNGVRVRTLRSTDEGVAYIVEADGLKIYHAGDLNWWHWDGEPEEENRDMAERYKSQIDTLKGERFDLAFVPVDPRLSDAYLLGLDYFMSVTAANMIFPMHFWNKFDIFNSLYSDARTAVYRDRIIKISHRGEKFGYK